MEEHLVIRTSMVCLTPLTEPSVCVNTENDSSFIIDQHTSKIPPDQSQWLRWLELSWKVCAPNGFSVNLFLIFFLLRFSHPFSFIYSILSVDKIMRFFPTLLGKKRVLNRTCYCCWSGSLNLLYLNHSHGYAAPLKTKFKVDKSDKSSNSVLSTFQYSSAFCPVHYDSVLSIFQDNSVLCTVQYNSVLSTVQYAVQFITIRFSVHFRTIQYSVHFSTQYRADDCITMQYTFFRMWKKQKHKVIKQISRPELSFL